MIDSSFDDRDSACTMQLLVKAGGDSDSMARLTGFVSMLQQYVQKIHEDKKTQGYQWLHIHVHTTAALSNMYREKDFRFTRLSWTLPNRFGSWVTSWSQSSLHFRYLLEIGLSHIGLFSFLKKKILIDDHRPRFSRTLINHLWVIDRGFLRQICFKSPVTGKNST